MSDVMDGWYKRPLDCAMPNLDAWRLGEAALNAAATRAGDLIDTGLVLLRLINEAGYDVIRPRASAPQASQPEPTGRTFADWWMLQSKIPYRDKEEIAQSAWNAALAAPPQGASSLRDALQQLVRGYMILMENGRDRIMFLGGQCDALDVMEGSDPYLRQARAALSASPLPAPQEPADDGKAAWDHTTWAGEFQRLLDLHWEAATGSRERTRKAVIAHVNLLDNKASLGWKVRAYAAPAPVDPESQGSSEPLSSQGAEAGLQGAASAWRSDGMPSSRDERHLRKHER